MGVEAAEVLLGLGISIIMTGAGNRCLQSLCQNRPHSYPQICSYPIHCGCYVKSRTFCTGGYICYIDIYLSTAYIYHLSHLEPADLVEVVPAALPAAAPGPGVVRPQVVAGQGRVKHHRGRGGRVTLYW